MLFKFTERLDSCINFEISVLSAVSLVNSTDMLEQHAYLRIPYSHLSNLEQQFVACQMRANPPAGTKVLN